MLRDLYLRKGQLVKEAQDILDTAQKEKRDLTAEETQKFDAIHTDIEKLTETIQRFERQDEATRSLEEHNARRTVLGQPRTEPDLDADERRSGSGSGAGETETRTTQCQQDHLRALRGWFMAGSDQQPAQADREAAERLGVNLSQRTLCLTLPDLALSSMLPAGHGVPLRLAREAMTDWERRAQGTTPDSAGGFTVPDEVMRALEVALLEFGGMRQAATVIRTASGADLPIPTTNDTNNEGVILAQNTQVAEQDVVFGQLVMESYKYSSRMIRVSVELMQDNAINLAAFLGRALGERIARITNRHFTVGTGTGEPNGLFTAATVGFTGAVSATAAITYPDLVETEHSVDPAYRTMGRWMFHDNTLKLIKLLVDADDRPLWVPGLAVREPDRILGYPYIVNQHAPLPAPDARSIAFGSLEKYWIRDVRQVTLLRLDERFADFHQVAFLAFSRHDGDLLDAGTNPVKVFVHEAAA